MSGSKNVIVLGVSLYPEDWQIIAKADTNDAGRSATLRRIIREWEAKRRNDDAEAAGTFWGDDNPARTDYHADGPGQFIRQQIGE